MEGVLVHELTHLLLSEHLRLAAHFGNKWLNEGLCELMKDLLVDKKKNPGSAWVLTMGIRFEDMWAAWTDYPAEKDGYEVHMWYERNRELVRWMWEKGGKKRMRRLLAGLREGVGFEEALSRAYPGMWEGAWDIERAWRTEHIHLIGRREDGVGLGA
jgi:hypothetical protein